MMKIKRFQGNITILALFVLLASALVGVLVALYMKNFMKYSEEISTFEKINYLAKAGTELGLAIVGSRAPGVEYNISSGDDFMKTNFDCPYEINKDGTCPHHLAFSLSLSGTAQSLNNCNDNKKIKVGPGLSIIIPLFKDKEIGNIKEALNTEGGKTLKNFSLTIDSDEWEYNTVEKKGDNLEISSLNTLNQIQGGEHKYLVISNLQNNEKELCLKSNQAFPQDTIKIVSIGYFKDKQLGIETITKQALPDFLQGDNYLQ